MPVDTTLITGSIATDHLMRFPGRFADQLMAEHLDQVSLSSLVDDLVVHRGGVGANIAFGMGVLGRRPLLAGAVGEDFAEYRLWLTDHGVDCSGVYTATGSHTARFTCTTDTDQCQIASFYPGAMSQAASMRLAPLARSHPIALALIGADDPDAMLAHTTEARELGIPFAADPSQQLPRLDTEQCRHLVDGAAYLFTNEYEAELLIRRTGWSEQEIRNRVGVRVTTLSDKGVTITGRDGTDLNLGVVPAESVVDPTGVGDGFRAGFFAALDHGRSLERAAQLGALIATTVLETSGTQEWSLDPTTAVRRLSEAYGADAATDLASLLEAP